MALLLYQHHNLLKMTELCYTQYHPFKVIMLHTSYASNTLVNLTHQRFEPASDPFLA
jgi:hypothetical protein